jgi:hypothetical protein
MEELIVNGTPPSSTIIEEPLVELGDNNNESSLGSLQELNDVPSGDESIPSLQTKSKKTATSGITSSSIAPAKRRTPMLIGRKQKPCDMKESLRLLKPNWQEHIDLDAIQESLDQLKSDDDKPVHWRTYYKHVHEILNQYFYYKPATDDKDAMIFSRTPDNKMQCWTKDQTYVNLKDYVLTVGKMKRTLAELLLGKPEKTKQKKINVTTKKKTTATPSKKPIAMTVDQEETSNDSYNLSTHTSEDEPLGRPSLRKRKKIMKPALKELSIKMNGSSSIKTPSVPKKVVMTWNDQDDDFIQDGPQPTKFRRLRKNDHLDIEAKETADDRLAREEDEADEYESDFIDDSEVVEEPHVTGMKQSIPTHHFLAKPQLSSADKLEKLKARLNRNHLRHPPQEIITSPPVPIRPKAVPKATTNGHTLNPTAFVPPLPNIVQEGINSCIDHFTERYVLGTPHKVQVEFEIDCPDGKQQTFVVMIRAKKIM